ncbi:hypothetical protein CPARA_2gp307 (nucleomorph) [Cryptomonas paramecium]|uniref:Uncharacterized protein n=1 Tax=Cryptomonas paramaecium TaxID=2898 RepID=F2HI19_9CRYP|nr:hypothetical protein CPARA_2gp307 [Cryptomonas paramecium]AEA38965.1 hypothetical protein CPARA_2gp307 [Cryptomonas paramecium]|mmetsp:Transcript_51907/g.135436  ORF Transcript_51907/g.135436 Transcript_51907/m.135436 type:complete len:148 (-) Transcript_51907:9022-9465(-)
MFICNFPTNLNLHKRSFWFKKKNFKIKANLEKYPEHFYPERIKREETSSEYKVLQEIDFLKLLKENVSLETLLKIKNINLNAREFPRDKFCEIVRGADESILDWLKSKAKLKLASDENDIQPTQNQTSLEEEFNFQENENNLESFFQ